MGAAERWEADLLELHRVSAEHELVVLNRLAAAAASGRPFAVVLRKRSGYLHAVICCCETRDAAVSQLAVRWPDEATRDALHNARLEYDVVEVTGPAAYRRVP